MCGRAGRRRELQAHVEAIHQALQADQLAVPALLADADGASVAAIVGVLTSLSAQIDSLHATLSKQFAQHPDAWIRRSLPGLGVVLGARVLGEFGDDPDRYADAKARKNYAGTAPITRASGKRRTVLARFVGNRRLADPLVWWAFCSLTCSPGARACYDRHRAAGLPISRPCAPWPTDGSASCTAACATEPATTSSPPGLHPNSTLLDTYRPWDVYGSGGWTCGALGRRLTPIASLCDTRSAPSNLSECPL
jgi:hypothetical protein